jgi:hypothetical protein
MLGRIPSDTRNYLANPKGYAMLSNQSRLFGGLLATVVSGVAVSAAIMLPASAAPVAAPASVSGYEVVTNGETLDPGTERQVVVTCPAAKKALGGGGMGFPS